MNKRIATEPRYVRTGYLDLAKFNNSTNPDIEVKKALVATVGTFKSSDGTAYSFSAERLNTIAEATNKALDAGYPLPVCTDHIKTFDSTVGGVEGRAYTKIIEEEDLPSPKASSLIGSVGLFLDEVKIKDRNAVDKVRNNVVTSVSMGLNLDPKDHRIIELSLVPIPAIPNMGMFMYASDENTDVYTWEDLETNEQSLDDLKESMDELNKDLWLILNNIYNSNAIDINDISVLLQYVTSALNGYNVRVLDLLGLSGVQDQLAQTGESSTLTANGQQEATNTQYQDLTNTAQYSSEVTNSKYTRGNIATFSRNRVSSLTKKYLNK